MISFLVGAVLSFFTLSPSNHVGVAAWCTVNKVDGTVQCNYNTKQECEDYKASDETCQKNPEPGKKS